ncbi:MAG: tetratricopeptide repeat protein, partial [Anaerolineales bacterium]|nr:tetratricopeptide repeat protein [Anaerolineales bacterium]
GEQAYRQAVAYRRLAAQPHALAHELNNLANLYQKQRRWELAASNYEEALAVLPIEAYPVIAAAIYNSLGTLHFNLDRLEEAHDAFREAARRYERLPGQTTRSALVLTNLGQLSLKLGQLPAALDYLQRAATIWRQYGQLLWLANVLGGLAEYFQRTGNLVQARSLYEEAIELLAAFPDNDWARKWTADFKEALAGL